MAGVIWEIDPTAEASGDPLTITDGTTYFLLDYNDDPNPWDVMRASSADTEGELVVQNRPTNRTVTITLRVIGATASALETTLQGVQMKVGKLCREGGTLKKTTPSGDTIIFDVMGAMIATAGDQGYVKNARAKVTLTFECKPYGRGPAVQLSDHVETTLPVATGVDTSVGGDVDATVKILIDEDQGADQWWVIWGLQSRYYDSATSAALFYEAEGRTAQGGSSTAAGPSGASGAGSNVMSNANISTSYQAILSTQATGGGAHLSHVGNFRVYARVYEPSPGFVSTLSIALEWATGDFGTYTRNAAQTLGSGQWDSWRLLDLGLVHISKVVQGTQRWEGRIVVKSDHPTAGDTLHVDYLMLIPVDEGAGVVSAVQRTSSPTAFSARDEFAQSAGALVAKTLPVGGTWTGTGGSTNDFAVETTGHTAQRTVNTDSTPRLNRAGTGVLTAVVVQCDITRSGSELLAGDLKVGVFARYVDASNYIAAYIDVNNNLIVQRLVAGVPLELGRVAVPTSYGVYNTVRLVVDTAGRAFAWAYPAGTLPGPPAIQCVSTALATGGTLATGGYGIYDAMVSGVGVSTRNFDNFWAAASFTDAAVFASQSLELRSDQVNREDAAGVIWQRPSSYEGAYPEVPPAGKEARSVRVIVKACRNDPTTMPDPNIDDLSFRATVTPRYLQIPA